MNRKSFETYLFAAFVALLVFPVWYFFYFPTADGPSHISIGSNLFRLISGECPTLKKLLQITPGPIPNYLSEVLSGLMLKIMPAEIVDKVLISAYLILLPLAARYFLKNINRENTFLIFPIMLLVYNTLLFFGSYNFLYSVIIYLFTLPWWMNKRSNFSIKNWLVLFVIFNLLYFTHLLGFTALAMSMGIICLLDLFRDKDFKKFFKNGIYLLSASLLSWIFLIWYLLLPKMQLEGYELLKDKVLHIFFITILSAISPNDKIFLTIITCFVWSMIIMCAYHRIRTKSKLHFNDYPLLLAFIFSILILITPAYFAGGWIIKIRFQFFEFLMLIIWLANVNFNRNIRLAIIVISSFLLIASSADKFKSISKYSEIAEMRKTAWPNIKDNSVIMSVDINPLLLDYKTREQTQQTPIPFLTSYLTANHCVVEVAGPHMSEMNTFPVTYKPEVHPFFKLGTFTTKNRIEYIPPEVDFDKYFKETGIHIDYLLIFGDRAHMYHYQKENGEFLDEKSLYSNFMKQVNAHFEPLTSSESGHWKIYKPKSAQ